MSECRERIYQALQVLKQYPHPNKQHETDTDYERWRTLKTLAEDFWWQAASHTSTPAQPAEASKDQGDTNACRSSSIPPG